MKFVLYSNIHNRDVGLETSLGLRRSGLVLDFGLGDSLETRSRPALESLPQNR